jgi:hypothetical protein
MKMYGMLYGQSLVNHVTVLPDYINSENFEVHAVFRTHSNATRLHGYIDDIEVCNPLGSAQTKHKLTAVYFYIGNLPKL